MELPDKDVLLELYRQLLTLRRFEEAVGRAYREGNVPGFVHLYIGQEAVAVGVCAHLERADYVTSGHRGHGHALAKGIPPREVMAELWGRTTGCSGGRGGSMHLFSKEHGLLGTNGVIGPSIVHAAGAAFSAKYHDTSHVAVAFFGDGGNNLGSFHEGLNLAAVMKLPVLFVCENNLYSSQIRFDKDTAGKSVAARATAYAMPGAEVDGQDVLAVYEAAGEAIARARAGEGPTLLECRTYRYRGHHEGDPGTGYRPEEEVEKWRKRDPVDLFGQRLLNESIATQIELDQVLNEVKTVIQDALDFAAESPKPSPDEASTKLFATPI
jgi:pyruvate dehydrogenase E1 component alpha subunit